MCFPEPLLAYIPDVLVRRLFFSSQGSRYGNTVFLHSQSPAFPFSFLSISITLTADLWVAQHNMERKPTWFFQVSTTSTFAGILVSRSFQGGFQLLLKKIPRNRQAASLMAFTYFSMPRCFFVCSFPYFSLRKFQQLLLCVKSKII